MVRSPCPDLLSRSGNGSVSGDDEPICGWEAGFCFFCRGWYGVVRMVAGHAFHDGWVLSVQTARRISFHDHLLRSHVLLGAFDHSHYGRHV